MTAAKSIFITGAAAGIGAETARLFVRNGWRVGASDVNSAALAALQQECGADRLSVHVADVREAAYFLILTYLLHTFGELCLSPFGLSTVTKLAPSRFVGQMMGVWFLASSLGKLTAGLIAGSFDPNGLAAMPGRYFDIVVYGCSVGLVLLLISGRVTRLMGGVK